MSSTAANLFPTGADPFSTNEWHVLDELWLYLAPAPNEFTLSYCYGTQNFHPRWLQFSTVAEIRFPFESGMEAKPKLATRAVVARPNQPVFLSAGENITLYVGTSLWLCLVRGETTLLDLCVARLSDTWFGPDTRRGELCFACRTHARLSMDGVRANPWKAITPVKVRNQSGESLTLDKINLPVPNLTLYAGDDRYWTSGVTITQHGTGSGEVEISASAPDECGSPEILASPRQVTGSSVWHRAADLLLG